MSKEFVPSEDIAGLEMQFSPSTCSITVFYGRKPELNETVPLSDLFDDLGITIWDCYRAFAKHESIRRKERV